MIPQRRYKGRKHAYSERYHKKLLKDEFNSCYFAQEAGDKTVPVPISLPKSLIDLLDSKLYEVKTNPDIKLRREGLTRSRYIRVLIERDLGVTYGF